MRIQELIGVTIAATLAGCTSTWDCDPDNEQFVVDGVLSSEDITVIVERWGLTDSSALECEDVCQYVYEETTGWYTTAISTCTMSVSDSGGDVQCEGEGIEYYCEGRRPLGHCEATGEAADTGGHLARCAHLESASEVAFVQLADWLADRDAPQTLVERCREAGRQESEHAAVIAELARAHGGTLLPLEQHRATADLLSVAVHNATEGCVFETWAALVAQWKADHALDPAIRAAYGQIATDEAEHGQLAWDLHLWLMAQLSEAQRRTVDDAQRAALGRLPEIARRQAQRFPAVLGMPVPAQAAEMAARLGRALAA